MTKAKAKQKLLVSHTENTHFEGGGLRPQFVYRELGVSEATGGDYNAHVIRGVPGAIAPVPEHKHTEIDFLFVYVIKGWVKFDYIGHGEHTLKAGSCHVIPPGLAHSVTGWSDDLEMVEVVSPAEYKSIDTVNGVEQEGATA